MKPLQVGLLVAAGALAGAALMKWQSGRRPIPMAVVASAPAVAAPVSAPAAPVAPAPAVEPPAPVLPSPFPEKHRAEQRKTPAKPAETLVAQQAEEPPAPAVAPVEPARPAAVNPPVRSAPETPVQPPAPPPAPPEPASVTLRAGTVIPVRLIEALSSDRNMAGDEFTATLDAPLVVDGFAIAERGARVEGKVVNSTRAGKVKGLASIEITLTRLATSDGQHVSIQTATFTRTAPQSRGEDAAKVGAGAGIGAIIGAIAGGGKGAAIGAGVGGAAGAGDVLLTRGKPAALASETRINFRLSESVSITERTGL